MTGFICEFCYKPGSGNIPESWDWVFQSAVCPDCKERVQKDGGYRVVKGGAYAFAPDPRAPSIPTGPELREKVAQIQFVLDRLNLAFEKKEAINPDSAGLLAGWLRLSLLPATPLDPQSRKEARELLKDWPEVVGIVLNRDGKPELCEDGGQLYYHWPIVQVIDPAKMATKPEPKPTIGVPNAGQH